MEDWLNGQPLGQRILALIENFFSASTLLSEKIEGLAKK